MPPAPAPSPAPGPPAAGGRGMNVGLALEEGSACERTFLLAPAEETYRIGRTEAPGRPYPVGRMDIVL